MLFRLMAIVPSFHIQTPDSFIDQMSRTQPTWSVPILAHSFTRLCRARVGLLHHACVSNLRLKKPDETQHGYFCSISTTWSSLMSASLRACSKDVPLALLHLHCVVTLTGDRFFVRSNSHSPTRTPLALLNLVNNLPDQWGRYGCRSLCVLANGNLV